MKNLLFIISFLLACLVVSSWAWMIYRMNFLFSSKSYRLWLYSQVFIRSTSSNYHPIMSCSEYSTIFWRLSFDLGLSNFGRIINIFENWGCNFQKYLYAILRREIFRISITFCSQNNMMHPTLYPSIFFTSSRTLSRDSILFSSLYDFELWYISSLLLIGVLFHEGIVKESYVLNCPNSVDFRFSSDRVAWGFLESAVGKGGFMIGLIPLMGGLSGTFKLCSRNSSA